MVHLGDTVLILESHSGYTRGQKGTVMRFERGRAVVRIENGFYAHVQPKNLKVLLDVYGKEVAR